MWLHQWNVCLEKELWDQSTCVSVILVDTAKLLAPCGRQNNGPWRCSNPYLSESSTLHGEMNFTDVVKLRWGDYPELSR